MTTQQKTAAIRAIAANHQDNLAAVKAANVDEALHDLVVKAMNSAFEDDLTLIFTSTPKGPAGG